MTDASNEREFCYTNLYVAIDNAGCGRQLAAVYSLDVRQRLQVVANRLQAALDFQAKDSDVLLCLNLWLAAHLDVIFPGKPQAAFYWEQFSFLAMHYEESAHLRSCPDSVRRTLKAMVHLWNETPNETNAEQMMRSIRWLSTTSPEMAKMVANALRHCELNTARYSRQRHMLLSNNSTDLSESDRQLLTALDFAALSRLSDNGRKSFSMLAPHLDELPPERVEELDREIRFWRFRRLSEQRVTDAFFSALFNSPVAELDLKVVTETTVERELTRVKVALEAPKHLDHWQTVALQSWLHDFCHGLLDQASPARVIFDCLEELGIGHLTKNSLVVGMRNPGTHRDVLEGKIIEIKIDI